MHFDLLQLPMLSRAGFDRADEIRDDAERMAAGWPTAKVLLVDPNGRYPVGDSGALHWVEATTVADAPPADAVFLGVVDGVDRWTRRVDHVDGPTDDARRGAERLTADEAGLLVTALGILNWHDTARHSPVDGSVTVPARGAGCVAASTPVATSSRASIRPSSPSCTTVPTRILLGRQAIWPDGWYSTLAGFVEPGESLEQCVIREVHEEVGIVVCEPRYLGSQPWPFPRSLMLGFAAIGDPADELQFLDGEIGDARWFHRDEVRAALSRDGWTRVDPAPDGTPPRLQLPGSISIARTLIESWAATG